MPHITASRLAMYEGIIALSWFDRQMTEQETSQLKSLIDGNAHFSDEERAHLKALIQSSTPLEKIWPRITNPLDRAHLLDVANVILSADGELCTTEKQLYEKYHADHLATLSHDDVLKDIRAIAKQAHHRSDMPLKDSWFQHMKKGIDNIISWF